MLLCGRFAFAFLDLDDMICYDPNSPKLGMAVNNGSINEFIKVLYQCTLEVFGLQTRYNNNFPSRIY